MGQFLLNGGDAAGIAAFDDIFDLSGQDQFLFFYNFAVFDDIDGNVVVNVGQNVQIQHVDVAFYLENVLFPHLVAAGKQKKKHLYR